METSRAVSSASEGVVESKRVILERYIKPINMTLVVELLVILTCDLLTILKVEHSEPISLFEIGFIVVVHMILLIRNRDTNINIKEFILAINRIDIKIERD